MHHCGPATVGDYVHTVQMIDLATGWSERAAVLGRSQRAMEIGFQRIRARLPIRVIQLHFDNGCEFLNNHPSAEGLEGSVKWAEVDAKSALPEER